MPRKKIDIPVSPKDVIAETLSSLATHLRNIDIASLNPKEQISMFATLLRLQTFLNKEQEGECEQHEEGEEGDEENVSALERIRRRLESDRKTY